MKCTYPDTKSSLGFDWGSFTCEACGLYAALGWRIWEAAEAKGVHEHEPRHSKPHARDDTPCKHCMHACSPTYTEKAPTDVNTPNPSAYRRFGSGVGFVCWGLALRVLSCVPRAFSRHKQCTHRLGDRHCGMQSVSMGIFTQLKRLVKISSLPERPRTEGSHLAHPIPRSRHSRQGSGLK